MKKWVYLLLAISIFNQAYALNTDSIVKKADQGRIPRMDLSFYVKVENFKGNRANGKLVYKVDMNKDADTLVTTIEPERTKNNKLLMQGNDLWFWTPNIKRPTRVSLQQRLTGEIANGDIARTNYAEDYDSTLEAIEKGSKPLYRLMLKSKSKGATYSKIKYWIEKKTNLPFKAEFYADSGKILKKGYFSHPKTQLGHRIVTKLTIIDELNKENKSVMTYYDFKKEKFDPSYFNRDAIAE